MTAPASHARISAIIPVYNGERHLAEAIRSVLAQGGEVAELIVVDDGSTDASAGLAARVAPGATVVRQANLGPGAARNAGAARATSPFLAFLDADDIWAPGKLSRQLALLDADPAADIAAGAVEVFISPELDPSLASRLHRPDASLAGLVVGAMLIRREVFQRVGPFATGLVVGEGIDWIDRARGLGLRIVTRPDVVLRRRLHATNLGLRRRQASADYARVLKMSLDRRRAAAGATSPVAPPPSTAEAR